MEAVATLQPAGIGRLWSRIWQSTLGLKYIMAVTGLGLVGFMIVHTVGNLQVFQGKEALNHYADMLQNLGGAKWLARGGLLALAVLHVSAATRLTLRSRAARPVAYVHQATVAASKPSLLMRWTGFPLLAFIVYHLFHFTITPPPAIEYVLKDGKHVHDVHQMVVDAFANPVYGGLYMVAMAALGIHLAHGISSAFQSLGVTNAQYRPLLQKAGPVVAWAIALAALSIPAALVLGCSCAAK